MKVHTVKQGDCFISIAAQYGFWDWSALYNHPDNTLMRKNRPNPQLLMPGDKVAIPEKTLKSESAATAETHTFKRVGTTPLFRVVLQDDLGEPLAGVPYRLTLDEVVKAGDTPGDGKLEFNMGTLVRSATLEVWLNGSKTEPSIVWPLKIGYLDPVEHLSGVQARLQNLGFDSGPIDGVMGPLTKAAVLEFQSLNELDVDGIPGLQTQGKLEENYGC